MEEPGFFAVQFKDKFVADMEVTNRGATKFPKELIVVPADIDYPATASREADDLFHYFKVGWREIAFVKLP